MADLVLKKTTAGGKFSLKKALREGGVVLSRQISCETESLPLAREEGHACTNDTLVPKQPCLPYAFANSGGQFTAF